MASNHGENYLKEVVAAKEYIKNIFKVPVPKNIFYDVNTCQTNPPILKKISGDLISELSQRCKSQQPVTGNDWPQVSLVRDHTKSEGSVRDELVSHQNSVSNECLSYIKQVNQCLICLLDLKSELVKEFADNGEITKCITNVFRDIYSLKSAYQIILETIDRFQSSRSGFFYLYEVFLDPVVSNLLKMYKPFLCNYSANAKWLGDFCRGNQRCTEACDRARSRDPNGNNGGTEHCLYTVFNSLFSLELMFDRYLRCFDVDSEQYQKAREAKNIISSLLSVMNNNQDKENFLLTQKELSLLTNRSRDQQVNTRFIYKGVATILSKRDEKPLSRQLVLFSDCLYVALAPTSTFGSCSVQQELLTSSMELPEDEDDSAREASNTKWSLSINTRWAVQRFYFENEHTLKVWREKILYVIKEERNASAIYGINVGGRESLRKTKS